MKSGISVVVRPVLVLAGAVEEGAGTGFSFESMGWPVRRLTSVSEFRRLEIGIVPRVVVCERDLHDGNWQDVLEVACAMPPAPPVIVTSRLADERLWAEVLNLGGYDVLLKPLDREEVRRSLHLAWQHNVSQMDVARTAQPVRCWAVS